MLSERLVRNHPERVEDGLRRREAGTDALDALKRWLWLDDARRALARQLEPAQEREEQRGPLPAPLVYDVTQQRLNALVAEQRALLARIPNIPRDDVPDGQNASATVELRRWGTLPVFDFAPKRHDDLAAVPVVAPPARQGSGAARGAAVPPRCRSWRAAPCRRA